MKKKKSKKKVDPVYILAIETATEVSSVALFDRGELLGIQEFVGQRLHAKLLIVMVENLLRDLEADRKELAAIAISKGPGSYTGLRVGVSTAKGLAFSLNIPLISVNSLRALACQVTDLAAFKQATIAPLIDARRMEVFTAIYDQNATETFPTEAKIMEEGAFAELLAGGPVLMPGNGAAKCRELFADSPNAILLSHIHSSARGMGKIAWEKFQNQQFEDLVTFEPFYLKEFIAIKAKNPFK